MLCFLSLFLMSFDEERKYIHIHNGNCTMPRCSYWYLAQLKIGMVVYLLHLTVFCLVYVALKRPLCAHMVFVGWCTVPEEVFYFHTPLLCFAGSTLRALEQTCSDRTGCSVPFSSMNYRQRPCSLQPLQPTSQTQQKPTDLVLFWGHALDIIILSAIADIWIGPACPSLCNENIFRQLN